MIRALYTAASGMAAQELNLDNIANNLSNSSTSGFRSRRMQFEDLIYQNLIMPGAAARSRRPWWPVCRSAWARVPRRRK